MNNNSIENFRIASKRTMASLGNDKLDLSHCILGMVSELEEYVQAVKNKDMINCGEEVIDAGFYVVNYMTFRDIKIDFKYTHNKKLESAVLYNMLVLDISALSDLVKKYIAYNKEIDKSKESVLVLRILITLYELCLSHGIDIEKAMQNNINKLLVRFPLEVGYNDESANSRNLKAERAELEK